MTRIEHVTCVVTLAIVAMSVIFSSGTVLAQDKIEISGECGYTWAYGFHVDEPVIDDEDYITPRSDLSYGAGVEYFFDREISVGFMWNLLDTKLGINNRNGTRKDVTDMKLNNFYFSLNYHFPDVNQRARPFVFFGLGWTRFSFAPVEDRNIGAESRFSPTFGAGVKIDAGDRLGFRLAGRWIPTYIKSKPGGMWCNWYGCWYVPSADYAHQLSVTAAVIVRL